MSQLNGRSVVVALDRERHLRYTFNALCELERIEGKSLDAVLRTEKLGFVELRAILWAGLVTEDATVTLAQVGEAIQTFVEAGHPLTELMDRVVEALTLSGLLVQGHIGAPVEHASPLASATSSTTPSAAPTSTSG